MLQEQKKTDYNSIIGFALIGVILFWFMNNQAELELQNFDNNQEVVSPYTEKDTLLQTEGVATSTIQQLDTTDYADLYEAYGAFAKAASATDNQKYFLENDLLKVDIEAKGARITSAFLKNYQTHDSLPLNLIREDSSYYNLKFWSQNRRLNSADFVFDVTQLNQDNKQIISFKLNVEDGKYLEYVYALEDNSYKIDYSINIIGLDNVMQSGSPMNLEWAMNIPSQEKNVDHEAMNTSAYYFADNEVDYLSITSGSSERVINTDWIAFKSQYFSSVLSTKNIDKEIVLTSDDATASMNYLKTLSATTELNYNGGNQSYNMAWYFIPNHVKTLKSYNIGLEELVPLGWSIIGWINKYIVINIFNTFESWGLGYGMIIFLMALLIKLVLFPFTYKSYTSMAKMRVLKPQIDAINEKHDDKMKAQQETMSLYRETGVNPLGGCIPMLFQMPILFALFRFFPASIELRQKSFLWATDLSTYDSILDLGFSIPFYGDHVSLFTLLMTVTTILQMKFSNSMSSSSAQMPQMKYMMYFMPVIFLGVMNSYAAALSYYYFLANLITFGQQKIIASMTDDSSLLAKLEENKKSLPNKGKSKFQARLEKMMKEQQKTTKSK